MKIRNTLILAIFSATTLFMIGCISDGSLSTVEYNNAVVETLNSTSAVIEETTTAYDTGVPNIVTEESQIDTGTMQAALDAAQLKLTAAKDVLTLVSKNTDQQAAVLAEFENYLDLGNIYITTYETVADYYSSGEYATNLDLVAEYDENLHSGYNNFIESNNTLVDTLASFIE